MNYELLLKIENPDWCIRIDMKNWKIKIKSFIEETLKKKYSSCTIKIRMFY